MSDAGAGSPVRAETTGDSIVLHGKRVIVILPAYRAEQTLARTYAEIPHDIVDEVLLTDDASGDGTVAAARKLGLKTFVHVVNLGYGANQKTCYREALRAGADIVVMLHPDYQYDPRLITAMAAMVASGVYDVVLGSRILGNTALRGGMPFYKYVFNRMLTFVQNILLNQKLSEYHTGYRAFSREVLHQLPLLANSDDFVFDNQMLTQTVAFGYRIGEVSCPTKYFPEASSISFRRSVTYGCGVLLTSMKYRMWKWGLLRSRLFSTRPTLRLLNDYYEPSSSTSPGAMGETNTVPDAQSGAPVVEPGTPLHRDLEAPVESVSKTENTPVSTTR